MKYILVYQEDDPDEVVDDPSYLPDLGILKFEIRTYLAVDEAWQFLEYSDVEAFAGLLLDDLEHALGVWFSDIGASIVEVDQLPEFSPGDEVLVAIWVEDFESDGDFYYHLVSVS